MTKIFVITCVLFFFTSVCFSAVLTVDDDGPADYSKIQDAINDAVDGDIVQVFQGHYFENIDFRGKAITATSTDPNDSIVVENTIIDANNDGIVVSFHSKEGPDSVLTGFTITGGQAKYGAGICCWTNSSPIVSRCMIENNSTTNESATYGGGIYCQDNEANIVSCVINNNYAKYAGGGIHGRNTTGKIVDSIIRNNTSENGAGIDFHLSSKTILNNCTIEENIASRDGGGINCIQSNITIMNCMIVNNRSENGFGGGVLLYGNQPKIKNSYFAGNFSIKGGGGVCCSIDTTAHFINTNFIANSTGPDGDGGGILCTRSSPAILCCNFIANRTQGNGGGISLLDNSTPIIHNCIVVWNDMGSGIYSMYSTPTISFNNVFQNHPNDYEGWAFPGEVDISVDPKFVDPGYWDNNGTLGDTSDDFWVEGNYHLHHDSPCINAGDPDFMPESGETDIDGEPRIRLGRVDMGADEADSNPADLDENGVVDFVDYGLLSAAWLTEINDTGWNPLCNISQPTDEAINTLDLAAYCDQWLWQAWWYELN